MSKPDWDIVIAGGGMVGVSLALCLRRQLGPAVKLLLVEGFALPKRDPDFHSAYSPSFDARSTALSYSSALIYRELELWAQLSERACPIEKIHVSEKGSFGSTLMCCDDYGWPALGYVIENAWLGNVLIQALHNAAIDTLSPARVVAADNSSERVSIELESGARHEADLLVVADGANSGLRASLGVAVSTQSYRQQALIANIGHAQPHRGVAFERFTKAGPLAMLPLPADTGGGARSALVWSLADAEAEQLLEADEEEFLAALQQRFGYRLGRLQRLGERHSYPLALMEADEQVRSGVVIMGNAAHALHPVAGQGFNLALRDVARLGSVLNQARSQRESPGDLAVLQRYVSLQLADQKMTTRFSDQLPGLFAHGDPALSLMRDVGLAALDISPALKREFVRYTSGVAASVGYRNVQP